MGALRAPKSSVTGGRGVWQARFTGLPGPSLTGPAGRPEAAKRRPPVTLAPAEGRGRAAPHAGKKRHTLDRLF